MSSMKHDIFPTRSARPGRIDITDEQLARIVELLKSNLTYRTIAEQVQVPASLVANIRAGRSHRARVLSLLA